MSTSPTMPTLPVLPARSPLLPHWRDLQRQLSGWAAGQADPHAELLALVWGPTWDWAQARQISDSARLPVQALAPVAQAFEASPPPHQQRLRQLILRHRRRHAPARWENAAPCPASC